MMTERELVAALTLAFVMERTAAHFRAESAWIFLLSNIENNVCDLSRNDDIRDTELGTELFDLGKIHRLGKAHIDGYRDQLKFFRIKSSKLRKCEKKGERILSARDADGYSVTVLDHLVVIDRAAGKAQYAFDFFHLFLLKLHIIMQSGYFIKRRYTMPIKLFIDQGHNPRNPNAGAEGNGYREQDITYAVGAALAELLEQNGDFEVRLSRSSPDEILGTSNSSSLAARVNAANTWGADYFISLHTNAFSSPSGRGVEAYVFSTASQAFVLGEDIVSSLSQLSGFPERGVFARPSLYVLKKTRMPSVLVEMGYITNPSEAQLMAGDPGLIALGIYNGILEYFGMR